MSTNAFHVQIAERKTETRRLTQTLIWGCGVSFALHIVLLATLSLIKFAEKLEVFTTISSLIDDEVDPLQPKFDTTVTDQIGNDSDINTFTASQEASIT